MQVLRSVCPQVGLIPYVYASRAGSAFLDRTYAFSCRSGRLDELYPELSFSFPSGQPAVVTGAGCDVDSEVALIKAVFETFERYANTVYSPDSIIDASANELGRSALDWKSIPTLYVRSDTAAPWRAARFDPATPIRWVKGLELTTNREVYVPFVMVYIFSPARASERFWLQTTTGVAAHVAHGQALAAALLELIEREAVEALWLTRAPLAEVSCEELGGALDDFDEYDSSVLVTQRYFDATTDFGIPVVCAHRALRLPIGDDDIFSCACDTATGAAARKARLEASGQQWMRMNESQGGPYSRYPSNLAYQVTDTMPGRPDMSFLGSRCRKGRPSRVDVSQIASCVEARGHRPIVVDLTTDDLKAMGIVVLKAVVPTMLPTSLPNAKYLRHNRIQELASLYHGSDSPIGALNLEPSPFC